MIRFGRKVLSYCLLPSSYFGYYGRNCLAMLFNVYCYCGLYSTASFFISFGQSWISVLILQNPSWLVKNCEFLPTLRSWSWDSLVFCALLDCQFLPSDLSSASSFTLHVVPHSLRALTMNVSESAVLHY